MYGQNNEMQFEISAVDMVEQYYEICSIIGRNNWSHQVSLELEKNLNVKDGSVRVNATILSVVIVDAWFL